MFFDYKLKCLTNASLTSLFTQVVFEMILMMKRNFILGFPRCYLRSALEITRKNSLIRSVGIALNSQLLYDNKKI